ncbi:MAG: alkene reductase [Chitinophagales bacterium]
MSILLETFSKNGLSLKNKVVMAPMTRSRSIGNIPNDLVATYYEQRAGAGLIITEGVSPSPNGLGYARIPGIFNQAQIDGWKKTTAAVHAKGSKIFIQLMHTGRVGHAANLSEGAKIVGPSPIVAAGEMWTDTQGMQPHPVPAEMTTEEVKATIQEYVTASKNAIEAGFDGVELHGANGYLIEQFIRSTSNNRTDEYGNPTKFVLEVAQAVADAIGKEKTGIRLSPYGVFNDMPYDDAAMDAVYNNIFEGLNEIGILYVHLVDHSSGGAPVVPDSIKISAREKFKNILILSGGYDKERADADLNAGKGDLIAFGKPFISNPDFVERMEKGYPLAEVDFQTLYTPDEKGYTDYPVYSA